MVYFGLQMETFMYDLVGAFHGELVGDFVGLLLETLLVISWGFWTETCLVILIEFCMETPCMLLWDSIMRLHG